MSRTQDYCDVCGDSIQPIQVNGPCLVLCSKCQADVDRVEKSESKK